jgi:predicted Fe-Mo cluster-binding NifX family protein
LKIAIPVENGRVAEHFGRCPKFVVVDISDGKIKGRKNIDNPGHNPGLLPDYFNSINIDTVITGGMGIRARELFQQKKINVMVGIGGKIDDVIKDLLNNALDEGESPCIPGSGKGYGLEKSECDHEKE